MTQSPPIPSMCASVTVWSQTKSMQIPIQLIIPSHSMKVVTTQALVDSGTDISCINQHFVQKNNLPTKKLPIPIQARNADHSNNKSGDIRYTCDLFIDIQGLTQRVTLHVMTCGKENIILGLPWLRKANPTIDWTMQTLTFNESIDESQELYQHHTADTTWHQSHYQPTPRLPKHINVDMVREDHLGVYLNQETESQYIRRALDNRAIHQIIRCGSRFLPSNSPVIARLTTATELAITTEAAKPKPTLPSKYAPFALVFLKEATDHIPPSRPYDHEINLDEFFKPKIGKVYSLSPKERKVMEDFLTENLKPAKFAPLTPHKHLLSSLSKKRTVASDPVKTITTSMNTPSMTQTLFPSFLTSSINSKGRKSSPSSTSDGDTIMSESKTDINGRLPSSPIKDSSNL